MSATLTPSIARGGILARKSQREGSVALGAGEKSSLTLTLVGNVLLVQGMPQLWWTDPQDPASMLFTLDDAVESMERESLDVGMASMLEALDNTTGALHDVVVPSGRVLFGPTFCPYPSLYAFYILTIIFLQSLIAHSQGKSH